MGLRLVIHYPLLIFIMVMEVVSRVLRTEEGGFMVGFDVADLCLSFIIC